MIRTSKKDIFFNNCSKCVILSSQRILYFRDSDFCILDISTNFECQTSSSLILYFDISTNFLFLTSPPIMSTFPSTSLWSLCCLYLLIFPWTHWGLLCRLKIIPMHNFTNKNQHIGEVILQPIYEMVENWENPSLPIIILFWQKKRCDENFIIIHF